MHVLNRLVVLFFAAIMAFSPVVVQATACAHSQNSSVVQVADNHAIHEMAAVKADHSLPSKNKHASNCTTCCLAHSVGVPLSETVLTASVTPANARIELPRNWAGVPDQAPNALLRPPRT